MALTQAIHRPVPRPILRPPPTPPAVYNNARTLNFQRFLFLVAGALQRAAAQGGTPAAANAAHLARLVLKDLMEQLNAGQLLAFVELPPPSGHGGGSPAAAAAAAAMLRAELADGLHQGSLVHSLTRAALAALAPRAAGGAGDYLLQLEAAQLLLVLCSSQLYSAGARGAPGQHPFLESLMQQRDLANATVAALLRSFVAPPPPPLSLRLYMPTDSRSVLRVVRSAASSVLWLPLTAVNYLIRRGGEAGGGGSPLGAAAMLLLLVLIFHAPPQVGQRYFLHAFFLFLS